MAFLEISIQWTWNPKAMSTTNIYACADSKAKISGKFWGLQFLRLLSLLELRHLVTAFLSFKLNFILSVFIPIKQHTHLNSHS